MREQPVFDFSEPGAAGAWRAIDDVVMGGVSESSLAPSGAGTAVFAGRVSLEHGGGFASVRSAPADFGLSGWVGLQLRLRGDGRVYKLRLRMDAAFDGVTYEAPFGTAAGEWSTVRLAFADLAPVFRGRPVAAEPLDPARITTLGLLISDRQEGPFRLEVASIAAWR